MPNHPPHSNTPRTCAFCRRTEHQVMFLIPSPDGIFICDECVKTCAELIDESLALQQPEQEEVTVRITKSLARRGALSLLFPTI